MKAPTLPPSTALVVSDKSAPEQLGLSGRQFLAFVRALSVPHVKVGRRVLARADAILAAIDRGAGIAPAPAWSADECVERAATRRGGSK